jgi:hypothetical protein
VRSVYAGLCPNPCFLLRLEQLAGSRLTVAEQAPQQATQQQCIGKRAERAERQVVVDVIGQPRRAVAQILEAVLVHPASKGPREHAVDDERRRDDALGLDAPGLPQRRRPEPDDELHRVALCERKRTPHRDDRQRARRDARRVPRVEMEREDVGDRSAYDTGAFEGRHPRHGAGSAGTAPALV